MRWDFLYRYYNRYAEDGGFKRLLNQGLSCDQALIPYVPALTACGHTSIYTGSVPAINGITGNDWWDYRLNKNVYCTEDEKTETVGNTGVAGKMSPRSLKVTTIGDELRQATNFQSKVIGIALKDRGAIYPAGQSANGAYWYDTKTGDWITSSYYLSTLPKWVTDFNATKTADKYFAEDWNTLYPLNTYTQSAADVQSYEHKSLGTSQTGFPYSLKAFVGKNYSVLPVTPYGNSVTLDLARAAIAGEQLGAGPSTDMLAISLSTPDYIGHNFGPNSVEAEDVFLRLDRDLGKFMDHLDEKLGKGNYLMFLTADHGAPSVPDYLNEKKIQAGHVDAEKLAAELNQKLKDKFKTGDLVLGIYNSQVYMDRAALMAGKTDREAILSWAASWLEQQFGIERSVVFDRLQQTTLPAAIKEAIAFGYYPSRCGDIQLIYQSNFIESFMDGGTTHGEWYPYDTHIPLLWYGWNVQPGRLGRTVYMTDIAPTLAYLLHIQMPSGSIGKVIEEVGKK
jgi:predicted AlkP superfamily pyrophosphatase or phosphodiesterase